MVMPLRTVSKIGSSTRFSAGRPTKTSVPPRRSDPYACSNGFGSTAVAIAASAPPRRWISATGSTSAALTVKAAPSSRASSSLSSWMSTAITRAPAIRAYCSARWPSPPMPNTATRSDGPAPDSFTALYVVTPAQVSGAASAGSMPAGTLTTWRPLALMNSAKPPSTE